MTDEPLTEQEARADIAREREQRHWTIDQWREVSGDEEWPGAIARCRAEADRAVDFLQQRLAEVERDWHHMSLRRAETEAQLAQARDALEFYADESNYLWSEGPPVRRGVIQAEDRGKRARDALAALEKENA